MNTADILRFVWESRPCFACGSRGACVHRELEADLAWFAVNGAWAANAPRDAQPWLPFAEENALRIQ